MRDECSSLLLRFSLLSPDDDPAEENLLASALGVISYAAGWLSLRPIERPKAITHMRSEYLRIHRKAYP